MGIDPIEVFLWRALAVFLLVGALSGIALALLLILKPQYLERINRVANRWISTRQMNKLLDRSIDIEHWFYRHHRLFGLLAMLGAGYILIYFGMLFDKPAAMQHLAGHMPSTLLDGLLDAVVLAMLTGAVVALFAGLFLWLRPSLLRGIEEGANLWVSLRRTTRPLDLPRSQVEDFVACHASRIGWLLLLASIYLFFAMLRWLVLA